MYIIYTMEEIGKGFMYVNLAKDQIDLKEGFKLHEQFSYKEQKPAVAHMLRLRTKFFKQNLQLDPNYLPPSKRSK